MKFLYQNSFRKKQKVLILIISIIFILMFTMLDNSSNLSANLREEDRIINNLNDFANPKLSSNGPNSKPLLISQNTKISKTFFPPSLPSNVSFTLLEGWTSKNVTINYDDVSHQKNWVINGSFETSDAPWIYYNNNSDFVKENWQVIDNRECVGITINKGKSFSKGDYGYFEENFTIPEPSASNTLATLSMDYYFIHELGISSNDLSIFISIDIGREKKNTTVKLIDLVEDDWADMSVSYDLINYNQQILGNSDNITLRVGVITDNNTISPSSKEQIVYFNNIQFTVWTEPNISNLIVAKDLEDNIEYGYQNTTFGKGKTFIDGERSRTETSIFKFKISKNDTITDEFKVYNITIISEAVKIFNSTVDLKDGSIYTPNGTINWQTEALFGTLPYTYVNNWAEIKKPSDWTIISILDGYNVEKKESCIGIEPGSESVKIPEGILESGLWKIKAESQNYITHGSINLWNGTNYIPISKVTFGDKFQINATLNSTIAYQNTYLNCTIKYPNGTLYWNGNKALTSYDAKFGDFNVGKNMTVGIYKVMLSWTNNQSYLECDKAGYFQFNFIVWHHTNLTAVNSYIETVSGEPLLLKVNFTDYDYNTYINSATITYNSTLSGGTSGVMAYYGSGIYVADIDTSGAAVGDYYFSFNASKDYFENHSIKNLIQLRIIYQPLALEVPSTVINTNSNSYAICSINVTGALTHTFISGETNISTDWHNPYEIKNDTFEGTYIINFSTYNVPTQGNLKTYTITIFANKTHYGSTSAYISLTVHPIPTIASVNESIIDVYYGENFYLEVNYLDEESNEVITGAVVNITWPSLYQVNQITNGFIVDFSTEGLSLDVYTILIRLDHPGYQTALKSIYVNIIPKSTTLEIFLNQIEKTSDTSVSISWNEPLNITIFYKDSMINDYIEGATVQVNGSNIPELLYENIPQYSVIFNPGDLPIGIHFITVTAQKDNYNTISSVIKITVEQIEIIVETIDFTNTLQLFAGKSIDLRINVSEYNTENIIENANITYSWKFYDGEFQYFGNGVYGTNFEVPDKAKGSYTVELRIFIEGGVYETKDSSFIVIVSQEPTPNYWIWIILIALLSVTGVLSIFLVRTYVLIPRKRKKEMIFMNTIQVFKDVRNIHGIMLLQKRSGVPIFIKNVSGYDFEDNYLISGFIQAITLFGEQVIKTERSEVKRRRHKKIYAEHMIDLNFQYFHLLICNYGPLKSILILKDKASKRLKTQLYLFTVEIDRRFSEKIEGFVGKTIDFKGEIEILLKEFFHLDYTEPFKLIKDKNYMQFLKKSRELQSIESRILNVIISLIKLKKEFTLNRILEEIDEKDTDSVYGGLHTLIKRRIIIPSNFEGDDFHPLIEGLK